MFPSTPSRNFIAVLFSVLLQHGYAATPEISTTKTATFDANGKGRATPGGVIRYHNVVTNNGASTVPGVTFTDATPANTTLLANSTNVSPIAINDSYSGVGNTQLRAGGSSGAQPEVYHSNGAMANDREFLGDTARVTQVQSVATVVSGTITATTPANGTVVMTVATGNFTYLPAVGFTGGDSFSYKIQDAGLDGIPGNADDLSDTATVAITISGKVWYVDGTAGTNGNGRSNSPFNNLTAVSTASATGDTICLYTASYTGGLTLKNNQVLLGRSHGFFSGVTSLLAASGGNPTIAGGLVLAIGNTIQGINLGNSANVGSYSLSGGTVGTTVMNTVTSGQIVNTAGGAVNIATGGDLNMVFSSISSTGSTAAGISLTACAGTFTVSAGAITNAGGADVSLSNGSLAFTYNGTITDNAGPTVSITGQTGGLKDFNGVVTRTGISTGAGIALSNNTGATIRFDGGLNLTCSGTQPAFSATGGGTVIVTDPAAVDNTISATTGVALEVSNTTIGSGGLVFRSIASGGGANNGITLDNTGSIAGLTVTGDGGNTRNGTGGTIQNKTGTDGSTTAGIGIYLNNTRSVSLNNMQLNDCQNLAIFGRSVDGFSLTNSRINGVNGSSSSSNDAAIAFGQNDPSPANGLSGAALINNVEVTGGIEHNVEVYQQSGSFNLTISNSNIHSNNSSSGSDGILIETRGTANATVAINNNTFGSNKSQAVQISTLGSSIVSATINQNAISKGTQGNEGLNLSNGNTSRLTAFVTNNTISGFDGVGVFVGQTPGNADAASDLRATITGNTITAPTTAVSHAIIAYLSSSTGHAAPARLLIDNNVVNQNSTQGIARGIMVDAPDTGRTPSFHATVTNNRVEINDAVTGVSGIAVQARNGATGRFNVRNNEVGYDLGIPPGVVGIRVRQDTLAIAQLERGTVAMGSTASNALTANNPLSSNVVMGTVTVIENNTVLLPAAPLLFAEAQQDRAIQETVESPVSAVELAETPVDADAESPKSESLSTEQLDSLVSAAVARWEATGLRENQIAAIRSLHFELADLPGMHLGSASGHHIRISPRPADQQWFVDPTPLDDAEFSKQASATRLTAAGDSPAMGRVDLLSTLMHEMGHALGLPDCYGTQHGDRIMYGFLPRGERRLPAKHEALAAVPFADAAPRYLAAPIFIGDLPPGKSVTIVYSTTIDPSTSATAILSKGTVSATGFDNVETNLVTTPVEQPPALAAIARAHDEDTVLTFTNTSFDSGFNDSNSDTPAIIRITSLPANGVLKLSGSDLVTVPIDISRASLPNLTFVPPPDFNGTTSFGWNATDGIAYAASASVVNITINAVDDLPTLAAISDPDPLLEDAGPQIIGLSGIAAGGGESQVLTVTAVSNNTALIPHPGVTYTSPGTTGSLSYTPVADQSGTAIITVTVTDAGGKAAERAFTVSVSPVNDAPTLSAISDPTAIPVSAEQQTVNLAGITAGGGESQLITVTAVSDNPGLIPNPTVTYTGGSQTGSLAYTPVSGKSGSAVITVTVSDSGGVADGGSNSVQQTFTVVVFQAFSVLADAASAAEGTGAGTTPVTFTVSRTGDTTGQATLDYAVTGSGATPATAADFEGTLPSGTVTIPVGQASAVVTINLAKDATVELNEEFTVTVADPNGGIVSVPSSAVTISNDDSSVVSITGSNVNEGDSASASLTFTVTLTHPVDVAVTVDRQSLATGTATAGSDFTALPTAQLSIPAGTTTADFTVSIQGDTEIESDETVNVSIANLASIERNVALGTATASGTILNDDPLLVAAPGSLAVKSGASGKLKISSLLALTTPVKGNPVSLVSAQNPSSAGAAVTIADGWIHYQPPVGYTGLDSFSYTITDGIQTVSGQVSITIAGESGKTFNHQLTLEGGTGRIASYGIPGRLYRLEVSADLNTWDPLGVPVTCPRAGIMNFVDPGPLPPQRFYRVVETSAP